MPIEIVCGQCGKRLRAPDGAAGKTAQCPACKAPVDVPLLMAELVDPPPVQPAPPAPLDYQAAYKSPLEPRRRPPTDLGDDAAIRLLLPVGRSGLAIAAGYFGLFAVLCFPAPIALVLGILAIRDIRRHPKKHGMGRAIFGLVMGILFTLVLAAFLLSALAESIRGAAWTVG